MIKTYMQELSSKKLYLIYLTIIIGILIVLNIPPIPQDPSYHNFADQRQIAGIANFWNVISNLPFILIALIAIPNLLDGTLLKYPTALFSGYLFFFIAIGAVGIGSAYYHFQPSNQTLVWDRLPMTVAFMAFMAIICGEYISEKWGLKLLLPLVLLGMASVIYWHISEQAGHGDLRPYGLVQFSPMLIIPMILLMFPSRYSHVHYYWAMLAAYLIAKLFEQFDHNIFTIISLSGHTIKHICAAIGPYLFYLAMKKRQDLSIDKP